MHKLLSYLIVPIVAAVLSATATANVGKVIIAKGETYAEDANSSTRELKRRSDILEGDTIFTGPDSEVHIRFNDNAVLALRADSQLKISQYHAASGNQEEKVLMELLSGGFRTITGAFGKSDKEAYQIKTPAASIGIRGTNYEAILTEGALFVGVYQGGVRLTNSAGSIDLGLDSSFSFARVDGPNAASKGLVEPPEELSEPLATSLNATPEENEQNNDEQADLQKDDDNIDPQQAFPTQNDETTVALSGATEPVTDALTLLNAAPDAAAGDVVSQTETVDLSLYADLRLTQEQIRQLSDNPSVGFVVVNDNPTGYKLANFDLESFVSTSLSGPVSFDIVFEGKSYTITLSGSTLTDGPTVRNEINQQILANPNLTPIAGRTEAITNLWVTYNNDTSSLQFTAVSAESGQAIVIENFVGDASDIDALSQSLGLCGGTILCSGSYANGGPTNGTINSATHFGYVVAGTNGPVFVNYETESITALASGYVTPDNVFIGPEGTFPVEFASVDANADGTAEVKWGYWAADATDAALLLKDPDDLSNGELVHAPYFYVSAVPANQADLVGMKTFTQVVDWHATTSTEAGLLSSTTGSTGANATLNSTLWVNFETSETSGFVNLSSNQSSWSWNMDYNGTVQGTQMFSDFGVGTMTDTGGQTHDVVGQVNGLFYDANTAVGFVGGFNMQTTDDTHAAEGVFVLGQ